MNQKRFSFSSFLQLIRQKSYFKRVLFSYIIVSCFTFIIFTIIMLGVIQRQYNREMLSVNEQNVNQAKAFNETSLYDISTYCSSLLDNNATLKKLLYNNDYDILTAINSRETYDIIRNVSSMVTSCDLINYSAGMILTKTSRMTLERYPDQDLLAYLETLTPSSSPYFWIPRTSYPEIGSSGEKVISLIFYHNTRGVMVVNLNYEAYASQLNLSDSTDNFQVFLFNQYGQVMASTDSSLFGLDYTEEELYLTLAEQNALQGTFSYTSGGTQYTVHYIKNGLMGITYVSVLTVDGLFLQNALLSLTLRNSLFYLVITLVLSLLSSWILYQPLQRLQNIIRAGQKEDSKPDPELKNEFVFLETTYTNLLSQNADASKKEQLYEDTQKQQALLSLITGNSAPNSLSTEALEDSFEYLNYLVLLFQIEFFEDKADEKLDISLIRFMVHNVISEIAGNDISFRNIVTRSNRVVLLANFSQYMPDELSGILEETQNFFQSYHLFLLSIGVGLTVTDLDSISSSYETASIALSYGLYREEHSICFYENMNLLPLECQSYPYEEEEAIMTALKNMSISGVNSALDAFFICVSRYHYEQIYYHLLHLSTSLQKFEYSNELPVTSQEQQFSFNGQQIILYQTQAKWKTRLLERCRKDIEELTLIRAHSVSRDDLISQVQALVEENIFNANLSVNMLAEQVGLSVNYLRSIYKDNTGESLSSYISGRKLVIICNLLQEPDLTIQEISDKLGFTTKNYFFTFFKKHTGMTPSQYRREANISTEQQESSV